MVSRVLGFVRDTVIARAFGAGMATDAFCRVQTAQPASPRFAGAVCPSVCADFGGIQETRSKEAASFIRHVRGCCRLCWSRYRAGHTAAPWVIYVSAPGLPKMPTNFSSPSIAADYVPLYLMISLSSFVGSVSIPIINSAFRRLRPRPERVVYRIRAVFRAVFRSSHYRAWAVFVRILQLAFSSLWRN
ncbi:virulence factor MviN [Neisseria meningitidis]|nr:virulence factor MviN [Neisseria meningitidis]